MKAANCNFIAVGENMAQKKVEIVVFFNDFEIVFIESVTGLNKMFYHSNM